jgi:7-cyano-7-deazaguanine synthase
MSNDKVGAACVLLSGGFDSTACLFWAIENFKRVRAVGYDYGQPHRDAELVAAGRVAHLTGIQFETVALADTMRSGLIDGVENHEPGSKAINRAFVPGRNLIFLSVALARACQWFAHEPEIDLVIGACREDAGGFPDCREQFFEQASASLSMAVDRRVRATAPFVRKTKAEILESVRGATAVRAMQESWSCYRGHGPCGLCSACVMRKPAFEAANLEDRSVPPKMTGGDVGRELGMSK